MDVSSSYSDSDQFQETIDYEDETQCQEADDMIDANEFTSDNSQREQRYANQQTNKKFSYVCQVFEQEEHLGKPHVKCKLCLPTTYRLAYCGSSTTTTKYHIKGTHPSEHDKLVTLA